MNVQQAREHAAWLDVCIELRLIGIEINDQDNLTKAVRKWGEELHQLRRLVPRLDRDALTKAREEYPGQYERGTYPEGVT